MILRLHEHTEIGLRFEVSSTRPEKAFLVGMVQDKIFFFKEIDADGRAQRIAVNTRDLPLGVARFTLFNAAKQEQAERLVFLHRDGGLHIELKPDKAQYLPRERVKLDILVHERAGKPEDQYYPVQGFVSNLVLQKEAPPVQERVSHFQDSPNGNTGVSVLPGKINFLDVTMSASTVLNEVLIMSYKVPLIQQDKTSGGQTLRNGVKISFQFQANYFGVSQLSFEANSRAI